MSVQLISAVCPNCGGQLDIPSQLKLAHCIYCGNKIIISDTNADPQKQNVDNWMKLADGLQKSNPEQAYQYYSKVLEYEPENYLAWLGKGQTARLSFSLLEPRHEEILDCFQKTRKFLPQENQIEIINLIDVALFAYAVDFYKASLQYAKDYKDVKGTRQEYWNRFALVFMIFKEIIKDGVTFKGYFEVLNIGRQICNEQLNAVVTRYVYMDHRERIIDIYNSFGELIKQHYPDNKIDKWPWYI